MRKSRKRVKKENPKRMFNGSALETDAEEIPYGTIQTIGDNRIQSEENGGTREMQINAVVDKKIIERLIEGKHNVEKEDYALGFKRGYEDAQKVSYRDLQEARMFVEYNFSFLMKSCQATGHSEITLIQQWAESGMPFEEILAPAAYTKGWYEGLEAFWNVVRISVEEG